MNEIKNLDYKMEWVDHLYEIYGYFTLRNDPQQWFYFLRRPEMTDAKQYPEIRREVMRYVLTYEHISQEIIKILEEAFKYSEDEKFFTDNFSIGYFDYYRQALLGREEFPPFRLFGELDEEADYDGFIAAWDEVYRTFSDDPEEYRPKIEKLKSFNIEHPYLPMVDCLYYRKCNEPGKAMACLVPIENNYEKHMIAGYIFLETENFVEAEVQFQEAEKYVTGYFESGLIEGMFLSKFHCGRIKEALDYADDLAAKGYEPFTAPLQLAALGEITERLMNNYKIEELDESDCIYICRYLLLSGDYDNVIMLCKKVNGRKFNDGIWTTGLAQAYWGKGEINTAAKIVKMCYDGKIVLSAKDFDEIRHLRAQILFAQGHIAKAYEIIETLCGKNPNNIYYLMTYANMCITTGRVKDAGRIYTSLRFNMPLNPVFAYKLGKCMMMEGNYKLAHDLFEIAHTQDPEYPDAAYNMVKASVFAQNDKTAPAEAEAVAELLDEQHNTYLQGFIQELNGNFKEAADLYKKVMDNDEETEGNNELLYDAYVRYFIMKEELDAIVISMEKGMLKALEAVPRCAELWNSLGDLYKQADYHPERAKGCYEKAFAADPFNAQALAELIDISMDEDNWRKALEYCDVLITNTQLVDYYVVRAVCKMELGMDKEFMDDITEYISRGGDKRETYKPCALFASKRGDYDKAIELYEKKLNTRKGDEQPCYFELATCMCKQGDVEEACELLDGAMSVAGEHPLWLGLLFKIQKHHGMFEEAANTLGVIKRYCGANFMDDDYNLMAAELAFESGKRLKASAIAETMISSDGEQFCAILNMLSGEHKSAERLLKKRIKKEPDVVEHYIWMAICQAFAGKHDAAAQWAAVGMQEFMKIHISPDNLLYPEHMYRYGILAFLAGDRQGAYEMLDKAANAVPCYSEICGKCHKAWFAKGLCKGFEGDMEAAKAAFDVALSIKPNDMLTRAVYEKFTKPAILNKIGSLFK